ncbi:MAG: copper-binding protein [Acidobacteria bacterium]|nr:copper-binding protein [Acidobacteriota bacterium]
MKHNIKIIAVILFITAIFVFACRTDETADLNTTANKTMEKQTYRSKGVVKQIDAKNGTITIDHEEIPGYMSAMEMNEPVSDKKLLESAKVGDVVEFTIDRLASKVVITNIKKVGESEITKSFEIYKTNCAKCHGLTGEGVEDKGISFLKGHALNHTSADFIKRVTKGKGDEMPAFKDKLTDTEIAQVVKFVREEIQSNADPKEKSKGHHH